MSVFDKLMNSMRIDSDPEDDEYYDDDEEYYDEPPKKAGLFSRKPKDDYYDDEEEPEEKPRVFASHTAKVATPSRRSMEIKGIKPSEVSEGMDIVDNLLNGKVVFINMRGANTDVAQRILDFVSGAIYSMNGKLQKISNFIFIATPMQVELSGDFQDLLNSVSYDASGMNMKI